MSEQRAEYNYEGKKPRPKGLLERLIEQIAAEPEQFAGQLTEDQAREIMKAIVQKYPGISKNVLEMSQNVRSS